MATTHERLTSTDRLLACAVCERTILLGEEPLRFTHQGRSRTVCRLCVGEARLEGWIEEGRSAPPPIRSEPAPGVLTRLRRRQQSSDLDPLAKLEQAVLVSFEAIDKHRDEVAIYQNDAAYLLTFERFAYLGERNQQSRAVWLTLLQNGIDAGVLRDTTGAGDAFIGGLCTAIAEGRSLADAAGFASAVAGLSVTRPGTAASMPARAEIDRLLGANDRR